MDHELSSQREALARDAGLTRLRRLTSGAVGAAILLSGVFAGLAASSTHPRKVVRLSRARHLVPADASAPALPPPSEPSAGVEAPPLAPPSAPPAPAPAESPPVVVSGGS